MEILFDAAACGVGKESHGLGGDVVGEGLQGLAHSRGEVLARQGEIEARDAFVDGGGFVRLFLEELAFESVEAGDELHPGAFTRAEFRGFGPDSGGIIGVTGVDADLDPLVEHGPCQGTRRSAGRGRGAGRAAGGGCQRDFAGVHKLIGGGLGPQGALPPERHGRSRRFGGIGDLRGLGRISAGNQPPQELGITGGLFVFRRRRWLGGLDFPGFPDAGEVGVGAVCRNDVGPGSHTLVGSRVFLQVANGQHQCQTGVGLRHRHGIGIALRRRAQRNARKR